MDVDDDNIFGEDDEEIRTHPSYGQVVIDVDRCAGRLEHMRQMYFHRTDHDEEVEARTTEMLNPNNRCEGKTDGGSDSDSSSLETHESRRKQLEDLRNQKELKRKLAKLIVRLLIKKPNLHYYQGFHDVCLTYMAMYGYDEAFDKLDRYVDTHFQAFMQSTMEETLDLLDYIPIIISLVNSKLFNLLEKSEVNRVYALSWVITWFSHVIPNQRVVEDLFRFLEKQDPTMVVYLSAAIVLYKEKDLLKLDPEMSVVHHFLCQVPRKEKLPYQDLTKRAEELMIKYPPDLLQRKLEQYRQSKLGVQNYNVIGQLANRLAPTIISLIAQNSRATIIVLVLASAIAFQHDKWFR